MASPTSVLVSFCFLVIDLDRPLSQDSWPAGSTDTRAAPCRFRFATPFPPPPSSPVISQSLPYRQPPSVSLCLCWFWCRRVLFLFVSQCLGRFYFYSKLFLDIVYVLCFLFLSESVVTWYISVIVDSSFVSLFTSLLWASFDSGAKGLSVVLFSHLAIFPLN